MTRITFALALIVLFASAAFAQRSFSVRASHYCSSCGGSRTATGRSASSRGLAVDPRLIPLGSRVYVPGHGVLVADDTGRAIKGRRIDIRLASRGDCSRRGVRRMTVRVLSRPQRRSRG